MSANLNDDIKDTEDLDTYKELNLEISNLKNEILDIQNAGKRLKATFAVPYEAPMSEREQLQQQKDWALVSGTSIFPVIINGKVVGS